MIVSLVPNTLNPQTAKDKQILVIDDDPDDFYLVKKMLGKGRGFVLTHRSNLHDAEAYLSQNPVDLVLLDLGLIHSKGLDTLKAYMQLHINIPVVVFTGSDDEELGQAAIHIGAEDYIPKQDASASILSRAVKYAIERHRLQMELERRAKEDALTGLPNRNALFEHMDILINHFERSQETFAVALMDLDGFKSVNDTYGHLAGDEVLCEFAERLQSELRSSDVVARLGGDEFIWILTNYSDINEAYRVVESKLPLLNAPIKISALDEPQSFIGVSIGMAEWYQHQTLQKIIADADKAMYESKKSGKNCITIAR